MATSYDVNINLNSPLYCHLLLRFPSILKTIVPVSTRSSYALHSMSSEMRYLLALPFLFLVIVLIRTFKIIIHYVEARRIGIPIIVTPISHREIWWVLIRRNFQWIEHLPFGLGAWYPYTNPGWTVKDRCRSHKKYGEAFAIVSPSTTHFTR